MTNQSKINLCRKVVQCLIAQRKEGYPLQVYSLCGAFGKALGYNAKPVVGFIVADIMEECGVYGYKPAKVDEQGFWFEWDDFDSRYNLMMKVIDDLVAVEPIGLS